MRAPPPLPRRAPGNLLIKIARAPPLRVRPLPPSPGGGRSSRPYTRSSTRPKRQPSVGQPSKHRIKNPETPDRLHLLRVFSPRPLPAASLLRRRRRQQLLLEAARDRPPAADAGPRTRPWERGWSGSSNPERACGEGPLIGPLCFTPRALGRAHSRSAICEALVPTAESFRRFAASPLQPTVPASVKSPCFRRLTRKPLKARRVWEAVISYGKSGSFLWVPSLLPLVIYCVCVCLLAWVRV